MKPVGPYSKRDTLAKLDGRTREARLMQRVREDLTAHLGGSPSATQKAMIEQAVSLKIRIALMDRKFAETGAQTDHDARTYLAWNNSLTRMLRQLGLQGTPAPAPSLADHIAARAA